MVVKAEKLQGQQTWLEKNSHEHITRHSKKLISLGVRLAVTLLLFAFLFKSLSWAQVWTVFLHIKLRYVVMGLCLGFFTKLVSTYQWQHLLRTEHIKVKPWSLFKLYLVGIAFNQFLPTSVGGDVVKAYYVGRDSGNNTGSISAVMMTRITGFFGMVLLALPALFIWQLTRDDKTTWQIVFWLTAGSILMLIAIGGALCSAHFIPRLAHQGRLSRILSPIFKQKLASSHMFTKVVQISNALSKSAGHPQSMIIAILLGVLFHLITSLNYYIYGMALHLNVPLYFYFAAIPLVALIAFLPISVNGFGVREGALVSIFSVVGVPLATSLLLVFVMDLQVLLFAAWGGCLYLLMGTKSEQMGKRKKC